MAPNLYLRPRGGAWAWLAAAALLSCAPAPTADSPSVGSPSTGSPAAGPPRALVAASVEAVVALVLAEHDSDDPSALSLATTEIHAAATGALARQIELGMAGDVFVSADPAWMQHLVAAGHAEGRPVEIARNRLAWIHRQPGRALGDIAEDLLGCFAIPDPDAVPLGRYTRQALTGLGLWSRFESRAVGSANARANTALLAREDCPVGVVYASDAAAFDNAAFDNAVVIPIDPRHHDAIRYQVVRLAGARAELADRLIAALQSEAARAVFERHGFEVGAS